MGSFALAAQLRMTPTGTTARLTVALPADITVTAAALVPALLSLGQRTLLDYRLTGHQLPEVEVTTVEQVEKVPAISWRPATVPPTSAPLIQASHLDAEAEADAGSTNPHARSTHQRKSLGQASGTWACHRKPQPSR